MLLVTTYRIKPFISKEETRELMSVFAEKGVGPGEIAHYLSADGSQGLVISEHDNVAPVYEAVLNYTQWLEYETKPFLNLEEAVPLLQASLS